MNASSEPIQHRKSPTFQSTEILANDDKKSIVNDVSREAADLLIETLSGRYSVATPGTFSEPSSEGQSPGLEGVEAKSPPRLSREDSQPQDVSLSSHLGQHSVKLDPRSFIQNVFNTDAMKMLEWLTPTTYESLISTFVGIKTSLSGVAAPNPTKPAPSLSPEEAKPKNDQQPSVITPQADPQPEVTKVPAPSSETTSQKVKAGIPTAVNNEGTGAEKQPTSTIPVLNKHRRRSDLAASPTASAFKPLSPSVLPEIRRRDPSEHDKSTKLHRGSSISDDSIVQRRKSNENHFSIPPKKTRIGLSPNIKPSTAFANQEAPLPTLGENELPHAKISTTTNTTILEQSDVVRKDPPGIVPCETIKHASQPHTPEHSKDKSLPQSLGVLTIETIELMCNILMADSVLEFRPNTLSSMDEARLFKCAMSLSPKLKIKRLPNTAVGWRTFTEQSLFYVLSDRKALIKSFTTDSNTLLDSRALIYCLMRISRVACEVLFEGLWIAAADLYDLPQELSDIQDGARQQLDGKSPSSSPTTTDEASRLMIICFHALIAAAPYSQNSLPASLSRGRGLSYTRHYPHASEYALALDDTLSDELALRLARRLLAAISARRHFQEIERLNNWESSGPAETPDILDDVLESLESFDVERSLFIPVSVDQRQQGQTRSATILIDWARTVMLQDWKGTAIVPADGTFGGALAVITALYKKRKSLLLTEQNFRTEFIADRLDSTEMPIEWLSFAPNKKTVHLLDYPFLFSKASLVTYFRAINFSRMSGAFDASATMNIRVSAIASTSHLITDSARREYLTDKLRIATSKFLVLQIRRDHVLVDAFNQLWRREERELLRPLKIKLGENSGEEGSDSGGVQQEFFRMAIAEALNPDYGAFTIDERTKMIWFQASSPEPLWKFELIGLLVGLAIYNGLTLPVTFPKVLYRKLLGQPVTQLHHIEDGWPELASGLTSLLEWDEKDGLVSDVFCRTYEYSIEVFGRQISRDLTDGNSPWPQFASLSSDDGSPTPANGKPEAPLVDASNREDYVRDYISHLTTHSVAPQFSAFQRGFLTCLESRSLALFTPSLLQSVVEGVQDIDISELRRYARYVGWDADHRTIRDFWSVVRRYSTEEKKKLLEFVTASDRVPVGGMRNLVFVVQRNGEGEEEDEREEGEEEGEEGGSRRGEGSIRGGESVSGGGSIRGGESISGGRSTREVEGSGEGVGKGRLPTSYTCYGTLLLPEYRDRETLKRKLGMALENARGFGFA